MTDEIWAAAADHYDEPQFAALILMIDTTNFFNLGLSAAVQETWLRVRRSDPNRVENLDG